MKQYELETGTLGFLELPSDAHGFSYFNSQLLYYSNICEDNKMGYELIHIGDGFKPLSLFSQLKEEDVKEVIPKSMGQHYLRFPISNGSDRWCKTAIEAIHSLAKHLGLDAFNPMDKSELLGYDINVEAWLMKAKKYQQAQSKVKQYFVIFKPKQKCTCTDEQSWNCIECIKPR